MKIHFLVLVFCFLAGFPLSSPAEEQNPAQTLVNSALVDFENKEYDDASVKLEEANKLQPGSAFILNLLGAIQTKKRNFPDARTYFEKALESSPGFFPAVFNLGELLFLQEQYPQALSSFSKMLNQDPNNELLQFKVILCLLMTNQPEDAQELLKRMRYPINSPARMYSESATEIVKGNKKIGARLAAKGRALFPEKSALYEETFDELGWATD